MNSEELLPWRDSRGPEALTDEELLRWFLSFGTSSPREISQMRRRESEIRLQCRYLASVDLLTSVGNESYRISNRGQRLLSGNIRVPCRDGYVDLSQTLTLPELRITDTSALSQLVIKHQNFEFYQLARNPKTAVEHDYVIDIRDQRRERNAIWNAKKWKLDRLLREFPLTEGAVSQCAHWMRTIPAVHVFPDANHRTGMATLARLVLDNRIIDDDHPWPGDPEEIGKAVLLSKINRYFSPKVTMSGLWRKDGLYWHWYQYFDYLLNGSDYPTLQRNSEKQLRHDLQKLRR